jgi:cyclopropane-fatty-acyl-phospholipid synthase
MNSTYNQNTDQNSISHHSPANLTAISRRAQNIISSLLNDYRGATAIRLWDGHELYRNPDTRCSLVFKRPGVLRELLLKRDLVKLGEAYLSGEIDAEGELEALFELTPQLQKLELSLHEKLLLLFSALRLPSKVQHDAAQEKRARRAARHNGRASIAHHYDVSNDFYRLWLDPQMVYSCAYFRDEQQSLADAQSDKLEHICRKLRLQPGQRLLDIGCGWGALVIWAAQHHGVYSHGITLSQQQYDFAQQRIRDLGLQEKVSVELRDYRDLPEDKQYDRIVSVGMFEHVGVNNFPRYFGKVKSVLKPGGLFLNHGITNDTGWLDTPITRFINSYVFPDGELARISDVSMAMEQAGFEVLDVESLRRHYAMTLRRWVEALEQNREAAITESSEATYRLWRLYMAGSAYYFDDGSLNIYQLLTGHMYSEKMELPLRRDDLYRQ